MLAASYVARQLDIEALPFLEQAASHPPRDAIAAYQLGLAALRIHERGGETALPRRDAARLARRALESALADVPGYAEAWATLAHAWLLDAGDPAAALTAARRARQLAPLRVHYALLEAQALMQRDDLTAARAVIERALEADVQAAVAEKLIEVLGRIETLRESRQPKR
jgi:cytochrome c-type biogenesis protein CcmH/NrfG